MTTGDVVVLALLAVACLVTLASALLWAVPFAVIVSLGCFVSWATLPRGDGEQILGGQ